MSLSLWGWNSFFQNAWRDEAGLEPARVLATSGDQYIVSAGAGEAPAEVSGRLLYGAGSAADLPAVGDWVGVRCGIVDHVLPRRTRISRRAAGTRAAEQIIAANVDVLFLVAGLDGDFNPRRMERYFVLAAASGAEPVCVLNKADLSTDRSAASRDAPGAIFVSAVTGEGLDELRERLPAGATGALLGSSGVGKSTLINHLIGADAQPTQDVRAGDHRGRHTTTRRQLFRLPWGGLLIDNPGLREVQLWAGPDDVTSAFSDIAELACQCRFADCSHQAEPGCAVREAVGADRLASFHKLQRETERTREQTDIALRLRRKRALRALHKAHRTPPRSI